MALSIYAWFKANDSDVKGGVTRTDFEDSCEIHQYEQNTFSNYDLAQGHTTGKRVYEPIVVTTRIDPATPVLQEALDNNAKLDVVFKWYHPDTSGVETHFYTTEVTNGNLIGLRHVLPSTKDADTMALEPMVEYKIAFTQCLFENMETGASFQYDWAASRGD